MNEETRVKNDVKALRKHIEQKSKFEQLAQNLKILKVVMFVDMVGSTDYKDRHSLFDGLYKVMLHNNIATKIIESKDFDGKVIKYIGDEVMACFSGDSKGATNAIKAGISIQQELKKGNKEKVRDEKIESQIGISYGEVMPDVLSKEDFQGTTVDIAKRLVGMAQPMQILIQKEVSDNAQASEVIKHQEIYSSMSFTIEQIISIPIERKVKGVKDKIKICEVNWDIGNIGGLGFIDSFQITKEWKKAHKYLTDMFSLLDGLKSEIRSDDTLDNFKSHWNELENKYKHPYLELLTLLKNSIELNKSEVAKNEMNILQEKYNLVNNELKESTINRTKLSSNFSLFSIAVNNFMKKADEELEKSFDGEEKK
ncbi:adenylate/guanylate cyclase domain-containing protein [bacterium]|nr:adenylate/guanylate cyclase domain-containing protein [bacterium]